MLTVLHLCNNISGERGYRLLARHFPDFIDFILVFFPPLLSHLLALLNLVEMSEVFLPYHLLCRMHDRVSSFAFLTKNWCWPRILFFLWRYFFLLHILSLFLAASRPLLFSFQSVVYPLISHLISVFYLLKFMEQTLSRIRFCSV